MSEDMEDAGTVKLPEEDPTEPQPTPQAPPPTQRRPEGPFPGIGVVIALLVVAGLICLVTWLNSRRTREIFIEELAKVA
jgi:hypothetical protein